MGARILELRAARDLSPSERDLIREVVREGRLLIFPTDTIYGLGCDAFNEQAIQRIHELKGRPTERPFSVHLGSIAEIKRYAVMSERQRELVEKLLPGPYTVVLDVAENAPPACVSDGKIGLRVPRSRSFRTISEAAERPLVGTSVNRSGEPPLIDIDEIIARFGTHVDLIVTADEPMSHENSTVIDLTVEPPRALRGELPEELLH